MSLPAGLRYRAMEAGDCVALARMLPGLLAGNWSLAHLQQLLDSSHQCRVLCDSMLAAEVPIGFVEFMVVAGECELLALAIDTAVQGCGLGRALLDSMLAELRSLGCVRCHLEVRRSNDAAIALYVGRGFRLSGLRKGYYAPAPGEQQAEDALLYTLSLQGSSD